QLSVSTGSVCARLENGSLQCWGKADVLGMGDLEYTTTHRTVTGFVQGGAFPEPWTVEPRAGAGDIVHLFATLRTCALKDDGSTVCWGHNSDGFIGDGMEHPQLTPDTFTPIANATMIEEAGGTGCGISGGRVSCWGGNSYGERVPGRFDNAAYLASGYDFQCGITSTGFVQCWGNFMDHTMGHSFGALDLDAGSDHACAVMANGTVNCWGFFAGGAILGTDQVPASGPTYEPIQAVGVADA